MCFSQLHWNVFKPVFYVCLGFFVRKRFKYLLVLPPLWSQSLHLSNLLWKVFHYAIRKKEEKNWSDLLKKKVIIFCKQTQAMNLYLALKLKTTSWKFYIQLVGHSFELNEKFVKKAEKEAWNVFCQVWYRIE